MEKRYLVYKNWNGQTHASIEYGEQYTGDGKKTDPLEVKRFEITCAVQNLKLLKEIYPLEEITDEKAAVNS